MKKKLFFIVIGVLIAIGSIWYILNGGTEDATNDTSSQASPNSQANNTQVAKDSLPDIIKQQKNVKQYYELLTSASLVETLQGQGPYTVLVPTDDAFKQLPEGLLDTLKKPENKTMLSAVLNYHIVKGSLVRGSFQNAQKLPTLNGQEVIVEVKDGKTLFISAKGDTAAIEKADITATNGTVHVVSTVLLPQ